MNALAIFLGMVGPWQIGLIVVVILLLFGGKKIPEMMRGLGSGIKEFKDAYIPDVVTMHDLVRDKSDYMRRQPRIDPETLSYNFEEYGQYSKILARSTLRDRHESQKFYKMVKYVKTNIDNKKDSIVRDFTEVDGYVPELIEIPEEF